VGFLGTVDRRDGPVAARCGLLSADFPIMGELRGEGCPRSDDMRREAVPGRGIHTIHIDSG